MASVKETPARSVRAMGIASIALALGLALAADARADNVTFTGFAHGAETVNFALSYADPAKNAAGLKEYGELPVRVLSDRDHENARRFHSYDDFEEMELHATILIDKKGRMYWARFGISTPNIFSTAIAYATPFIMADM